MVKSKALSNPPKPLQIFESSTGLKDQFSSEKTYSYKLDAKRLKHAPGSRVASVIICTPYSIPQAEPKLQNHYFHKKTRTGFYFGRFSKINLWNSN